ncbi:hypothetical protein ACP70R_003262 [Stipagrostis hirtigluma subsp. patula]
MAASQGPRRKTVSRCTQETDRCTHVFDIASYSLFKGLGDGKFVQSATFVAGGHEWCIRFYPEGHAGEEFRDYVAVYLELMTKNAEVRALFDFRLVNQATGRSASVLCHTSPVVFKSGVMQWGSRKLKKKSELESSPYLQSDRLLIKCNVTVIMGVPVSVPETTCEIAVPPSDLSDDLARLLEEEKRADVGFNVKGEVFRAHKFVLAMRSTVFEAELYGLLRDNGSITIKDMEPDVFKALLHFIYTDSLPSMEDLDGDDSEEMVKHLLVAADRYAMERMKLMRESILCEKLVVENVANILALADQHHCNKLKDACTRFISSSDRMDDLMATKGYEHLKRACPSVFMDIWEKAVKSRKL